MDSNRRSRLFERKRPVPASFSFSVTIDGVQNRAGELDTASLQKYKNMIDAWGGWALSRNCSPFSRRSATGIE
jgi:hypothetical protein